MVPIPDFRERFRSDLDELAQAGSRLGVAVSGGPDSLALLLLAAAVRPGLIEAATVDHGLRSGSRDEAFAVEPICARLGVPHAILAADWPERPASAVQERARKERYRLLAAWAERRQLDAIVTAHHADDQAETLLMRLNRGSGVRGLAAMRARSTVPGSNLPLLRPLLSWRRADLQRVCEEAEVLPAADPSNADDRFERVRVRAALASADWIDPAALAASADHLASADEALDWSVEQEWRRAVECEGREITYAASDAPPEIVRRIVTRAIEDLSEPTSEPLRAREINPLLDTLQSGGQAALRGVLCAGGNVWRFTIAPPRRHRTSKG